MHFSVATVTDSQNKVRIINEKLKLCNNDISERETKHHCHYSERTGHDEGVGCFPGNTDTEVSFFLSARHTQSLEALLQILF